MATATMSKSAALRDVFDSRPELLEMRPMQSRAEVKKLGIKVSTALFNKVLGDCRKKLNSDRAKIWHPARVEDGDTNGNRHGEKAYTPSQVAEAIEIVRLYKPVIGNN